VMGCCGDCDEPSETLQDVVIFSELNEYFGSVLGQSWSGSVLLSVTEICSRFFFFRFYCNGRFSQMSYDEYYLPLLSVFNLYCILLHFKSLQYTYVTYFRVVTYDLVRIYQFLLPLREGERN